MNKATLQGAPLLSRTDPGDGFDYMLAGWLSNNSQSAHIQSNQDVHDCHFQNYQTPGNQYANNQGQVVYPSQCSQPAVRQQNLPMYTPGQYQAQVSLAELDHLALIARDRLRLKASCSHHFSSCLCPWASGIYCQRISLQTFEICAFRDRVSCHLTLLCQEDGP